MHWWYILSHLSVSQSCSCSARLAHDSIFVPNWESAFLVGNPQPGMEHKKSFLNTQDECRTCTTPLRSTLLTVVTRSPSGMGV